MRRAALIAALGLSLGAASDAAADVVVVSTGGVQPRRAHVAPGGTVRWENGSPAAIRIQSLGRPRFTSLNVEAGRAGERRFDRAGRYRYTIPGTVAEALVIVGAEVRRPRPRGNGCDRREVFLYDAVVEARKSFTEEWVPKFKQVGAFSISYAYRVAYPRVAVVLQHECGTGEIDISARGRGAGKLSDYTWADSVRSADPGGGSTEAPCEFAASVDSLGGTIRIKETAFIPGRRGSFLSVASRLTPAQRDALAKLLDDRRDAVCDKGGQPNTRVFDGPAGHGTVPIFQDPYRVAGGDLFPPLTDLSGDFFAPGRSRALQALVAGRSFSVSSGQRDYDGTGDQTHVVAKAGIRIRFTRRHG
jgi:hypothetical protein